MKKWLLKRLSKPLMDAGLGHAPTIIHQLLHRPELITNALAVAFIEHVGAFDSLGLLFFSMRVMKKLQPKGSCQHGNAAKQKKEAH